MGGTTLANAAGIAQPAVDLTKLDLPTTNSGNPSPPTDGKPPTTPAPGDGGFKLPTDIDGWLKLLGPLLGGGLAAWEASQANGQQNPTDAWTRDWARNKLNNPQAAPQPVTGQYRDKMMGMLGQQNPAIAGLLGKRYY